MNLGSNLVTCMMRTDTHKLSSDLYMYVAIHVCVTHNKYKMTLKKENIYHRSYWQLISSSLVLDNSLPPTSFP